MTPEASSRRHRPVDVLADVRVAAPAGRLTVRGTGRTLAVDASNWRVYGKAATSLRLRSRSERRTLLYRLGQVLRASDIEVSIQTAGREIARLGTSGVGSVALLLGLPGARIRVGSLLRALLRSLFGR